MSAYESGIQANGPISTLSRRSFLSGAAAAGVLLPAATLSAVPKPAAAPLVLKSAEPWTAHPKAAVVTEQRGEQFAANGNGTRICSGGWQWHYDGIIPGGTYDILVEVNHQGLTTPMDMLRCMAVWGVVRQDQSKIRGIHDSLLPKQTGADRIRFSRCITAPDNAKQLTLRAILRWTAGGTTVWQAPRITPAAEPPAHRAPVRVCAVTGDSTQRRNRQFKSLQDNIEFYGGLCEAACRERHPQLIVLPEIALQLGIPGDAIDTGVPAPGPETEAFAMIARKYQVRIGLGMYERDGDAVYNSLILISPSGTVDGRYRKVHLAAGGEDYSGLLPGDDFPVFDTEVGRVGCNICMDSSAVESSRMIGLNGADFLLMPIMGDHRADRWSVGSPIYNEDRWRVIMRTHAIDNMMCMAVARNDATGSCIVNCKGEFLAWNDGDQPYITADVSIDQNYRYWNGGSLRDVNWLQRRPHLYGAFTDPNNVGGLR